MIKTSNVERSHRIASALVLSLSLIFAGCATTPKTELAWPGFDTTVSKPAPAKKRAAAHTQKRTAQKKVARNDVPAPKLRPRATDTAVVTTRSDKRFVWPVSGRILSRFGNNPGGEFNDGINIAANIGDPIHAADSGTVTYAGNELRGYGNLVLIRHDDGYVTAYAHAQSITVTRGDRVLKGQVIGFAGETGDVVRPQLHFEIRRGVEPVDPAPLLVAMRQI